MRKNNRNIIIVVLALLSLFVFTACDDKKEEKTEKANKIEKCYICDFEYRVDEMTEMSDGYYACDECREFFFD